MFDGRRLSLPGLLVLIAVLLVVGYLERSNNGGGSGGGGSSSGPGEPRSSAAANNGGPAGTFDYYALVLSWSPTHCESPEGQDDDMQCARRDGRRYAFILHGLWPQYARGYPESCPTRDRPYVPQPVIDDMIDIMPGKGLIIHEYRKHGTCSGLSPDAYYRLARRLYESLKMPEQFRKPSQAQFLDPRDVVSAFVAANPGLRADMLAVACRGPGSRLREVRVCFSRSGALMPCGDNERQGKLCRGNRMHVPPVR